MEKEGGTKRSSDRGGNDTLTKVKCANCYAEYPSTEAACTTCKSTITMVVGFVQCIQCEVRYSRKYNTECPRCRSRVVKEDYPETLTAVLASRKSAKFACSTCSFESNEPYCEVCVCNSTMIRVEDPPKNACRVCGDLTHTDAEYCSSCSYEWDDETGCRFCGDQLTVNEVGYCTHCKLMKRDKQDKAAQDVGSLAASLLEYEEPEESRWARSLNKYWHKGPKSKLVCIECGGYVINETFLKEGFCKSCVPEVNNPEDWNCAKCGTRSFEGFGSYCDKCNTYETVPNRKAFKPSLVKDQQNLEELSKEHM